MSERKEKISKRIETIDDALEYIVNPAVLKVQEFNWQSLNIDMESIVKDLAVSIPVILRNSGRNLPFNLLDLANPLEVAIFSNLPPHHKVQYATTDQYWLVLRRPIEIDEAEIIRDLILKELPSHIASIERIDISYTYQDLIGSNKRNEWDELCDRVKADANVNFDKEKFWVPEFSIN